ncbi:sensor histidine kinase [Sulfitobacter delicatus]|uniref:histidine kinase n=1 Tax=Sulfitobacter delicatus TaxID=218672 RepID=A0A1G7U2B9_9RHOB|nr:HAMP domain-containing sensor histidine kinase [Sulfitobacter delicatus]SDG41742.1 His Kinase A (phospho-acceptor) domain-containing protein [Sulfitobacter delicatus]
MSQEKMIYGPSQSATLADATKVQQMRDYSQVGVNLFWQRQMIFAAAICLSAFYYELWLSISTLILIAISETYDYILFLNITRWRGRSPRLARMFMRRIYISTVLSAGVISYFALGIALEQGATTHFLPLFFLFAAALFASMNNHHILPVLMLRLAMYGVTFLFIPIWDIVRTGATIDSELWTQLFTVVFVLYFIVDCSRIFLKMYRTNARQLEELKAEHEKTKIAFKAKTEFVSTISHELRTPMTSIKGSLDMACAGVLGEMSPQMEKVLKIAQRNSARLTSIINEILDLQKFEAGKISFDIEPLEVQTVIEDAIELNQAFAGKLNVTLRYAKPSETAGIATDEKRLQQVMSNLLSNAAKFSPAGSTVKVTSQTQDGMMRISVIDEGIGLAESEREKVFDEFSQIDSSDQRAVGGTGLGMNISKRIIEALGGKIDYFKNDGPGTTFFIDLPLNDGKGSELAQEIAVREIVSGKSALDNVPESKAATARSAA